MKKLIAALLCSSMILGGLTMIYAAPSNQTAEQSVSSQAPVQKTVALTTRIEPIRMPEGASVVAVYRWEGDQLYRSGKQETVNGLLTALKGLKDADVVLNIPNIKPADIILEMRVGQEDSVRYHIFSKKLGSRTDQIIYQKVEDGLCFQGMGFTGGNISDVISNLSKVTSYESKGILPFTMEADMKQILLLRMGDLTTTKITSTQTLDYIESLFGILLGDPYGQISTDQDYDCGKPLTDITDIMVGLQDGTRFTLTLYERGIKSIKTERSLNVPEAKTYRVDKDIYAKLLASLRQNQSACSPMELSTMDVNQILSIELVNPSGTKMKTLKPGQKAFDSLVAELQGMVVQPLSLKQQTLKNQLLDAYSLRILLNSDEVYTVNYNSRSVEVSSTGFKYASLYTLADGFNDSTRYFDDLLK